MKTERAREPGDRGGGAASHSAAPSKLARQFMIEAFGHGKPLASLATAAESERGQSSQSMDPFMPTNAADLQSPIRAFFDWEGTHPLLSPLIITIARRRRAIGRICRKSIGPPAFPLERPTP